MGTYWSTEEQKKETLKKVEDMSLEELEKLNEKMREDISKARKEIKSKLDDMGTIVKEINLKKAYQPIPFVKK